MASLCIFDGLPPLLELRGLCNQSILDCFYYPVNIDGEFYWVGVARGTIISYNQSSFQWVARIYGMPNIQAIAEASFQSLLLGKSMWTVSNDRGCSPMKEFDVNVSLSSCDAQQFACNDGHCVDLETRCDGLVTCQDGSDEVGCWIVYQTARYNRNIAPPNTTVHVTVHVRDVLDIDVRSGRVRILAQIMVDWLDTRLTFVNLKPNAVNSLSQEEYEAVWRPVLIYTNMEPTLSKLVEEPGIIVKRVEQSRLSGMDRVDRAETFSGSYNSLQWSETIR